MGIALSEKQKKEGWAVVRFDEIARNISERVEPAETDLKIYVGLEHLDPQSLRITRRGVPSDVEGQKLRVRPGQIIFGKRRAYQKKVAVADFDGICSAHAMVLQEIPGKIISGLLPFFMQSDMFMDRAVAISEGSLSPTIKWKALTMQEFPLPPVGRQREILEVLEKVEECYWQNIKLHEQSLLVFKTYLRIEIGVNSTDLETICNEKRWKLSTVGDTLRVVNNKRTPISSSERTKIKGIFPYYGPTGKFDEINCYNYDGTFSLIGEDGDHFLKWNDQPMTQLITGKFNVNNHAHVIAASETCLVEWFYFFYYHNNICKYLTRQGAGRYKLTKQALEKLPIPVPSLVEQKRLCTVIALFLEQIGKCSTKIKNSSNLLKKISTVFLVQNNANH